jgi:hypothetical protein
MSTTTTFDTLMYAKKLQKAGFTPQQAEVQAEAMKELIDNNLATKQDIRELEERLTYRLTLRLGSLLIAGITAISILVTILSKVH